MEQTKSALRGKRNSCKVMEPLEADMQVGSGAAGALFWPVGSPFRRSSSAINAFLLSARNATRKESLALKLPLGVPKSYIQGF